MQRLGQRLRRLRQQLLLLLLLMLQCSGELLNLSLHLLHLLHLLLHGDGVCDVSGLGEK